uniref:Uncharacterized protein n=1 Tax=Plectus sambesii TaxID=2011161 RepID=A0A914UNV8_9BILA
MSSPQIILHISVCTTPFGHWSFELVSGVTDFAYKGVALNTKYFCFFGCLNTKSALQNYKVLLANGTQAKSAPVERTLYVDEMKAKIGSGKDDQSEFCPDPYIENIVMNGIQQAPINNATSIANTILLRMNRGPGWAVVVVQLADGGAVVNSVYPDWNFCDYSAIRNNVDFYNVKVAKIDMS